ncbi:MAG: FAD-binding protein [Candidatus Eisenbacteria bacterium]|uniref:FAD-binding protein n=1 Tax=Eiseniibacteriota bacterium TaxID=2212470 RepID=A0A538TUK8_UNCEI|nr:MAG: FAD-binding protein [Candidatus Eisenbacteria bacterium]
MTEPSFLEKTVRLSLTEFAQLTPEHRASIVRPAFPDLNVFFDEGRSFAERRAARRSTELAQSLWNALTAGPGDAAPGAPPPRGLAERIVTDDFLRAEADRDQNVYLGRFFTRTLTRAVPDLIFQPETASEAATALRWARDSRVPVTLRGAASTAMGGSVPNDGGLTLDLSRLDHVEVDAAARVCVVGAGARLRTVHARLAARGLALEVYPSNLGGTLAGWFLTGGIGLNAYSHGRALDSVKTADLLLPSGEHVRLHDDGRLDVLDGGPRRKALSSEERVAWFRGRGYEPLALADLAGSEGVLGLLLQLTVAVEPRREIGAFLLAFETRDQALEAVAWIGRAADDRFAAPANLKLFSASHLHHIRAVWRDEDARAWHERPGALSSQTELPWSRIAGPAELGAVTAADFDHAGAYLLVDFLDLAEARAFALALPDCPGAPRVLAEESVRVAAERFKPQQTKRLGPGLVAAEIVLPAAEVPRFLPEAEALVRAAGNQLDAEVYYLGDGTALAIGAYLADHRCAVFAIDLMIAPALLDLAMRRHRGTPYVLGRWQSAYFSRKFGGDAGRRLAAIKRRLDPTSVVSRGVLFGLELRGVPGALIRATFVPGVAMLRAMLGSPLAGLVRAARRPLASFRGPAFGRGEPAAVGATFAASRPGAAVGPPSVNGPRRETGPQTAAARALNCVNCGECNSVCPVFHESAIRLPQMLTHLGELVYAGQSIGETGSTLLDLCMRCGKCEEVCQAGIPHLPLYEEMQQASDRERPPDRGRHMAILAALRGSPRYTREFLDIRPGGYLKRTPASLPGMARYLVLRSENDAGPAATCIHCGACVAVCPTLANREFEGSDARWITTLQERCIGCGTCVEVCPANHRNGGQTLRVMEAPTRDWFVALDEFERQEPR